MGRLGDLLRLKIGGGKQLQWLRFQGRSRDRGGRREGLFPAPEADAFKDFGGLGALEGSSVTGRPTSSGTFLWVVLCVEGD